MLSEDEIELARAAFPEIQEFSNDGDSNNNKSITVEVSSEILKLTFRIKLQQQTQSSTSTTLRVSVIGEDVDPLIASDFEQYMKREFESLVVSSTTSSPTSELLLQLLQIAAQFDPKLSNPLRASLLEKEDEVRRKRARNNNDSGDDDDESNNSDDNDDDVEPDFTATQDWAEFSRRQAELKQRRIEREKLSKNNSRFDEPQFVGILAMHHIYCCFKRRRIIELAADLNLVGFYLFGKPGRVLVQGGKEDVESYLRAIKSIPTWKMCKEIGLWADTRIFEPEFGFQAARDEAHIKAMLSERGEFFAHTFHFSSTMANCQ